MVAWPSVLVAVSSERSSSGYCASASSMLMRNWPRSAALVGRTVRLRASSSASFTGSPPARANSVLEAVSSAITSASRSAEAGSAHSATRPAHCPRLRSSRHYLGLASVRYALFMAVSEVTMTAPGHSRDPSPLWVDLAFSSSSNKRASWSKVPIFRDSSGDHGLLRRGRLLFR